MKKTLLLLTFLLATCSVGWAGACGIGTLADYTAAGFSCSVGSFTFSNFTYISSASGGATAPPAGGVAVSPITSGFGSEEGLLFTAAWLVGTGQTDDSFITYTVTCGVPCTDLELAMVGGAVGTGAASVAETSIVPPISLLTFVGGGTTILSASTTFAGVGSLNLEKDISLSGGTNGGAHISGVYNLFSNTTTPEPASILLFGSGLLALGGYIRRRHRKAS